VTSRLNRGIAIHQIGQLGGSKVAIEISPGIEPVAGASYSNDCYVPLPEWHSLDVEEEQLLAADGVDIADVVLCRVLDNDFRDFQKFMHECDNGEIRRVVPKERVEAVALSVVAWLNTVGLPYQYLFRAADLAVLPPNLRSTALDRITRLYKGLHVDGHEQQPTDPPDCAVVLLNINIGMAYRYYHFINQPLRRVVDMIIPVAPENSFPDASSRYKIKSSFCHLFSRYPVCRAVLPPGYGYISQTQNLIHDGGSNNDGKPDVSLFISLNARPGACFKTARDGIVADGHAGY
jgi:hypothetical protein